MSIELGGSRVLVTGGAGFIGSFIVDQMIEAGADHVTIVDDFVRGRHMRTWRTPSGPGASRWLRATSVTPRWSIA